MTESEIRIIGGVPNIYVNGTPIEGMAYMTYKMKESAYDDMAKIGYKLFCVPLYFTDMPINERTNPPLFGKSIYNDFYTQGVICHEAIDETFEKVLSVCPDAFILPRLSMSTTAAWDKDHPDELVDEGYKKERRRPCFSSDIWAEEIKKMLVDCINYIENSKFRDNIIGYQVGGGNTEEWFPFSDLGPIGIRSREKFIEYCKEFNTPNTEIEYRGFLSYMTAKRICEFAETAKKTAVRKVIVGSFYGYTFECVSWRTGHHALSYLLNNGNVDFICSPTSYSQGRKVCTDHYNMLPVDSLALHKKLYFSENDHRTHLTEILEDCSDPYYFLPVWQAKDKWEAIEMLKMVSARAITHKHALWWFDMWGGWYKDDDYLKVFKKTKEVAKDCLLSGRETDTEVGVFIDEKGYRTEENILVGCDFRDNLGLAGAQYDVFLASDFKKVCKNYKFNMLIITGKTELDDECIRFAKDNGVNLFLIDKENYKMSAEEIMALYKSNGVTVYSNKPAVIYKCKDYAFIHTVSDGEQDFSVLGKREFTDLFTGEILKFPQELKKGKSYFFKINE